MSTPAGWYPDPTQVDTQRYWDGEQWTDQRAPLAPTPTKAPNHDSQQVRQNLGLVLIGLLGLGLFLLINADDQPASDFVETLAMVGVLMAVVGLIGVLKLATALLSSGSEKSQ